MCTNRMRLTILFLALFFGGAACGQTASLTAISNLKGAPAEIRFSELKSVLMGERQRWANGKKVLIALMKTNTPVGKSTSEKIYNMSADELKKFWLALVFQGKADAPTFFNTVPELQAFVADNPGAIGIIDMSQASYAAQVILVDGKRSF